MMKPLGSLRLMALTAMAALVFGAAAQAWGNLTFGGNSIAIAFGRDQPPPSPPGSALLPTATGYALCTTLGIRFHNLISGLGAPALAV